MVSVGGTGSYNIDADFPGVTEIQPGSYMFMDSHYNKIGGRDSPTSTSSATPCRCSRRSSAAPSAGAPSSMPAARRCRPTIGSRADGLTGATLRRRRLVRGAETAESESRAEGRRSGADHARPLRHDSEPAQRVLRGTQGHGRARVAHRRARADRLITHFLLREVLMRLSRTLAGAAIALLAVTTLCGGAQGAGCESSGRRGGGGPEGRGTLDSTR